jgi:hypothetical protein
MLEKPARVNSPTSTTNDSVAGDICAFAPLGTAALYILLAVYCRTSMGHWPRYHEYLTAYDLPIFKPLGAAFLLSGALSIFSVALLWGRWLTWHGAVFILGWVLLVALVVDDPYSFTSFPH